MNRPEGKSLDDEIKRYSEQLMSRYAQSSQNTPPPPPPEPQPVPQPVPQPAPQRPNSAVTAPPQRPNTGVTPAEPELEDMAEPTTTMPEPAPQRPNTGVTPAAPQRPNSAVTAPPAQSGPEADYQQFVAQNPQRGILRVQTLTARGTYPVPGVKVVVSKMFPSGEHTIATQETDNAGKTEGLLLPAPDRSLSEQPGNGSRPFADYKLTVIQPDFATIVALQVPVFAGESSLQVLNMIPLSAAPHGSSTIEYITTEPSDL